MKQTKWLEMNNASELKSFLGTIQILAKTLLKLSEKTDRLRKCLKKTEPWRWEKEKDDYIQTKQKLTVKPSL